MIGASYCGSLFSLLSTRGIKKLLSFILILWCCLIAIKEAVLIFSCFLFLEVVSVPLSTSIAVPWVRVSNAFYASLRHKRAQVFNARLSPWSLPFKADSRENLPRTVSPLSEFQNLLPLLYNYMRNFWRLIDFEQWYFSLIRNTFTSKSQTFDRSSMNK